MTDKNRELIKVAYYWLAGILIVSFILSRFSVTKDFAETFSNLVQGLGLFSVVVALFFAFEQQRHSVQAAELLAIQQAHAAMNNPRSYKLRKVLFERFEDAFNAAIEKVPGLAQEITLDGRVSFDKIELLRAHEQRHKLFHKALGEKLSDLEGDATSALEVVELILMDFDLVAISHCSKNDSARVAIKAWTLVFERTARLILPFIAVERRLRPGTAEDVFKYKYHYLKMLSDTGILSNYTPFEFRELPEMI